MVLALVLASYLIALVVIEVDAAEAPQAALAAGARRAAQRAGRERIRRWGSRAWTPDSATCWPRSSATGCPWPRWPSGSAAREREIAIRVRLDPARADRLAAGARRRAEELDPRIAGYLLSSEPDAQRDLIGHELLEAGVEPLELMELDEAARRLRALPSQAWATSDTRRCQQPSAGPAGDADEAAREPAMSVQAHGRLQPAGVRRR